jgi:hypothetical protein
VVRLPGSAPFPQAFPFANQPSSGLSRFLAKSSGDGDYRLWPIKTVSLTNTSSAEWHLPETENSDIRPFSKPGMTQAHPSYSPSLEGWWRECRRPLKWVVVIRRCSSNVGSTPVVWGTTLRAPEFQTGPLPISKPSQGWAAPATRRTSIELVWRVLKPPVRMAVQRPLNEVVGKLKPRRGCSHSPKGVWLISSAPLFCCLHTALEIGSY